MYYLAIILCAICVPYAFFCDEQADITAISALEGQFHIVLDAGHGGIDNGASAGGVTEAALNLQIVFLLQTELTARGFFVSLTRTDSESLASPYAANKKQEDMQKRREKIRKLAPDLVISIHQNKFPSPAILGLQCFYAAENTGGIKYAAAIQEQFNQSGLITYKKVKQTDFNLCEHSPCPAVLIECGFLSNPTELKLLQTTAYQQILAWNIAAAVARFQQIE
jgi:N-acetylmuramoyl-L-alanine amidase